MYLLFWSTNLSERCEVIFVTSHSIQCINEKPYRPFRETPSPIPYYYSKLPTVVFFTTTMTLYALARHDNNVSYSDENIVYYKNCTFTVNFNIISCVY